jgi:hypothetical protein
MKIDDFRKASKLMNERDRIDGFIYALESIDGNICRFSIMNRELEFFEAFPKAAIIPLLLDKKSGIDKELTALGVEL